MVKPDQVERIVHGLIREHLARTGKKDILKQFDLDVPRKEDSLTKTKLIVSAFGSAGKKLYKQNKESKKPLTSVLDIMSNHYYKVSSKKSGSEKVSTYIHHNVYRDCNRKNSIFHFSFTIFGFPVSVVSVVGCNTYNVM